eukprot:CAMPEP_0204619040 /NCGR_PEP_ID=MMETSP0717-20131115/5498_1 /ASSEMBLY_ACC=CAM_ASM_000666 /TAXON_ID=230516 /ORGANISM="Chaetoceros curvisetus" /LENGTH=679 /DNA_ID=CAMNT_0051632919 /DNA_START=570 /DNA_END=2609 /DNA_ORIENTATION=+
MLQDSLNYSKASHANLTALHESHAGAISRTNSVLSLSGLDVSEPDLDAPGPIATLMQVLSGQFRNIRLAPLLHLVVFTLMMYGTLSDASYRKTSPYGMKNARSKEGNGMLGAAMISSVTDALYPILPFAGGVDLRRNEHWEGGWRSWLSYFGQSNKVNHNNTEAIKRGQEISSMPRGGAKQIRNKLRANDFPMILSASDPFLPENEIEEMTLREISLTFRYAIEAGREGFDLDAFLAKTYDGIPVNARMEKAVRAIDDAVVRSRGKGVLSARTSIDKEFDTIEGSDEPLSGIGYGDIDALQFCGAMRLLAEWRVLRQVPPGYKQYAVGMTLGHKDVVQNVAKIESAAHEWIASRSDEELANDALLMAKKRQRDCFKDGGNEDDCKVKVAEESIQRRSPTLRQLLQHEIDNNTHNNSKLPRLKDKTAAMGLLWVRRQLHYQTTIFDNVISVPKVFSTAIEAVGAAYSEVYGDLHGWAVQKIFNYSFQSAPKTDTIFRHMNPRRLAKVKEVAAHGTPTSSSETGDIAEIDLGLSMDDAHTAQSTSAKNGNRKHGNPFIDFFDDVGAELDKFGRHIGQEWDKVGHAIETEWDKAICNASNILNHDRNVDCEEASRNIKDMKPVLLGGARSEDVGEDVEEFISREMRNDARDHILVYLKIVRPMLQDLAGLFDEMNMDDPTKV